MATGVRVRIVILHTDSEVWCELCEGFSAITICYVTEFQGTTRLAVHRLTYCERCEDR